MKSPPQLEQTVATVSHSCKCCRCGIDPAQNDSDDLEDDAGFHTFWTSKPTPKTDVMILPITQPDPRLGEDAEICETFQSAIRWTSAWGGVSNWEDYLESRFQSHLKTPASNSGKFKSWLIDMYKHADRGRKLQGKLEGFERRLPSNEYLIRLLWRRQFEILTRVIRGVVILETRLGVIHRRLFSIGLGYFDFEDVLLDFAQRDADNTVIQNEYN